MRPRLLHALCVGARLVAALEWVSVAINGSAVATYTPTATASTTVPAPPSYLTETAAYVLLLPADGSSGTASKAAVATATVTTTTTMTPPVASAVAAGSAGAFLLCHSSSGSSSGSSKYIGTPENSKSPFCQPADGTQIQPGGVYYVTWDPTYFDPNTSVTVAAAYSNGGGFVAAAPVNASTGFYPWAVNHTFLQDQQAPGGADARLAVTWSLLHNDSDAAATGRARRIAVGGPTVVVTARPVTVGGGRKKGVSVVAVAVPVVVVGVALLAALVGCVCAYRHTGRLPLVGGLAARRTASVSATGYPQEGYPLGPPKGDPAGGWPRATVADPERAAAPPRPAPGVNVFREELKRQEERRK